MPTRILRDGINDSEAVNLLTAPEEVFYRRLMSAVDDFGRFDARPAVLRSRLYPLKPKLRDTDISLWIAACVKAGLIALYEVDGKQYILFHKLGVPRAKTSKYPVPPAGLESSRASVNICAQTRADVPYSSSYSISDSSSYSSSSKDRGLRPVFRPPSLEEVRAYCLERGKGVDPEAWMNHYEANGWKVGKNSMKSWKAAVRTWERNKTTSTNGSAALTLSEFKAKYVKGTAS